MGNVGGGTRGTLALLTHFWEVLPPYKSQVRVWVLRWPLWARWHPVAPGLAGCHRPSWGDTRNNVLSEKYLKQDIRNCQMGLGQPTGYDPLFCANTASVSLPLLFGVG